MFYSIIGFRGSGKSSYACKIARKYQKKGIPVYSNFPIKGCYLYDCSDIGRFDISNCVLILDEAGIDLNNRDYKNFSKSAIQWWKLSRHYGVQDIYVFSQANDYDITLRRLSDCGYIITKGILPHFSRLYKCKYYWSTDENSQPCIKMEIAKLFKPFFRKPYYKMFDSFECPKLEYKEFPII